MSFSEQYKKLKPSVVAIVSSISSQPDFPDIIGTGFIADSEGIVVTNNHVIKVIEKLPRRKNSPPDEWPVRVLYLHDMPGKGMGTVFLEVEGVGTLSREKPVEGYHYGDEIPDIGIICVKAKGLPALEIESDFTLSEGDELYIAGFPMGTRTLRAPGWIHQINPVLQHGMVSAIQPFPCEKPHGLLIEAVTQGGSSGSPIFNPKNGKVAALLYGGLQETGVIQLSDKTTLPYRYGTAMTVAVPGYVVSEILQLAKKELKRDVTKYQTLEEMIRTLPVQIHAPKTDSPGAEAVPASEIEYPKS